MAHPADNSGVIKMVDERVAYEVTEATSPLKSQLAAAQTALTAEKAKTAAAQKQYDDHMASEHAISFRLGTSWGVNSAYLRDVQELGVSCRMVYWNASATHAYSNALAATISGHDVFLSVDGNPLFDVSMMPRVFDEWEAKQDGHLYVMGRQEPEKNWTPAQWQGVEKQLVAMTKGRAKVTASMGFTAYSISSGKINAFYDASLGLTHSAWSMYALVDEAGIPKADPVGQVDQVADWAAARNLGWACQAAGYPLSDARLADPVHVNRRIDWVSKHVDEMVKRGGTHYPWFNVDKGGNLDYLIQNDPKFRTFITQKFA